eukprot:gene20653-22694_t
MFGNTAADQSFEVKCLEQLVCLVYGQQGLSTVGTARWALFSKKGCEAEKLPPTKGALIPHINRARFFTIIACGYSTSWISWISDVDECFVGTHNCSGHANCTNNIGSYSCRCLHGFTGNGFLCNEDRLFAYSSLSTGDDSSISIEFSSGIPLGISVHFIFHVCANGLISFGSLYCTFVPQPNVGRDLLFAWWTDLDTRLTNADGSYVGGYGISQHVSTDTDHLSVKIFNQTKAYLQNHGTANECDSSFSATNVFVATWKKATPYPFTYYREQNEFVTFQIVIATDTKSTCVFYIYDDEGMQWNQQWIKPQVGYAVSAISPARIVHRKILNTVTDGSAFRYDKIIGNTGHKGRWAWKHATNVSNDVAKCYGWYAQQPAENIIRIMKYHSASQCPRGFWQARLDWRFRRRSRIEAQIDDTAAFDYCCRKSSLCDLYKKKRPMPIHGFYRPPLRTIFWGDPHITTLDGFTYTFNGIGDYVLLEIKNSTEFTIHTRLCKAEVLANSTTRESAATVYCGFAMKTDQGAHVELYQNVSSGFVTIFVNKQEYNVTYFNSTQTFNDTDIQWTLGNKKQFSVYYESGVGAVIEVLKNQLISTVSVPQTFFNKTQGLIGTNNNDKNDDLTRPNGTHISINSTQEYIYYEFGALWNVTGKSLFTSPMLDFDPSFVPNFIEDPFILFGNNTVLKEKAIATCGLNNKQCLFDMAMTADSESASESIDAVATVEADKLTASTYPPSVIGPTTLTVTYGQMMNFTILSNGTGTLHFSIVANGTTVVVNSSTGFVQWFVNGTNFRLKYIVRDSNNRTGTLSPFVNYCHCLNGASCNSTKLNTLAPITNTLLQYGTCTCLTGYTGAFCQNRISYCEEDPCFEGVNCTENFANLTADCAPCPEGYIGDGRKCYDLNECVTNVSLCNQLCTNFLGGYNCSCYSGFELSNATYCGDIDECSRNQHSCHNFANCTNIPGSYNCTCNKGFTGNGTFCSDFDECAMSAPTNVNRSAATHLAAIIAHVLKAICRTGFNETNNYCLDVDECHLTNADCNVDAFCNNTIGSYGCFCKPGFSGDGKINCADISECALLDACHANATCFNQNGNYSCRCINGYTGNGTVCTNINECDSNPCHANATCNDNDGSYTCRCNIGYTGTGESCTNINECDNSPCHANATCNDNDGSCNIGYTGTGESCTNINECDSSPCHGNATCNDTNGSYTCRCNIGYTGTGESCTNVNECDSNPCHANATCNDTNGSYTCRCTEATPELESCTNINECDSSPCHANATCNDNDGSYTCRCDIGYTGTGQSCTNINECDSNPCHANATCNDTDGSYTCRCNIGYTGTGESCTNVNECDSNPCHGNATCNDTNGSYTCRCDRGYTGTGESCTNVNECDSNPCHANATCNDTNGSYTCRCNIGYTGTGESCTNINECNNNPCHANATCNDNDGSYTCRCDIGYTGTGQSCTNINECDSNPCHANATCNDTNGSYTCRCNIGYTGTGESCTNVNECDSNPCHGNATCNDTDGSYTCRCDIGYTGTGQSCTNINECDSNPCHANATCNDTNGSYTCRCNIGYTGTGESCTNVNECDSNPCHGNATCNDTDGSYTCRCDIGYTGTGYSCTNINECDSNPCHTNATCNDNDGSYACRCNIGYTGTGESCTNVNECDNNSCHANATCNDTDGSYTCRCDRGCNTGYARDGTDCTNVNECLSNPCDVNADCLDSPGSFSCICKAGFSDTGNGLGCAGVCEDNPCKNNGVCKFINGSAKCSCPNGLTGTTCESGYGISADWKCNIYCSLPGLKVIRPSSISVQQHLANKNSQLYKELTSQMEKEFTAAFKNANSNVQKVTVRGYRFGSLIVDITITFIQSINNTIADLEASFLANMNSTMQSGSIAEIRLTDFDECASGIYCNKNAICKNLLSSFSCTCKSSYTGNGFVCTEKRAEFSLLAIVVSVVVIVLLVMIVLLVGFYRKFRNKKLNPNLNEMVVDDASWEFNRGLRAQYAYVIPTSEKEKKQAESTSATFFYEK